MKYTIKRNNKDIATVSPTGSLNCKIMAEEVVQMQFVLPEYIAFKIGDTVSVYGTTYVLNQEPSVQKISTINYAFELQFESFKYDLNKVLCLGLNSKNELTEPDYAIMGDPMMLLKHLVANANRLGGNWKVGEAEKLEPKNISFSNHNVLSALSMCAEEFETEYWVDGNKTIHLTKKQAISGLSLKYGMSQGLRTISRTTLDSSNVLTRLYAQGSTQNIPVKYRYGSARLKMDVPFLEKNVDKFGLIEFSKTFEDIYPRRNGKVTAVFADDPFRFVDSSQDFDLNGKTSIHGEEQPILLPGVSAKVTFNTGQLAGYTFEIKKNGYDHSKKSFVLLKNKDEKAYEIPNNLLKPAVGDEYVLTEIVMPEVYITNAEVELKKKAQEYLDENSVPRLQYAVQSDPIYFENQNINLQLGNTIKFVDSDFGLDANIRVVSISKDLQNPYQVEFSIAEQMQQQKIVRDYIEKNKKEQEIRESSKKFNQDIQRNYEFSQEINENVFDAEGYFDPQKIKPLSIETKMLSVGSREQQFTLEDLTFMVEGNNTALRNTKGQIVHYSLEDKPRTWSIPANTLNGISTGFNFIYIKAQKVGNNASVFVSPNQIKVDQDAAFYHFEAGYLSSISDGLRKIRLSYGFATINGREITAGRITSQDGKQWFDLDTGEMRAKVTFTDDSPALGQIDDKINAIEVGGRNLWSLKNHTKNNYYVEPYHFKYDNDSPSNTPEGCIVPERDKILKVGETITISYNVKLTWFPSNKTECSLRLVYREVGSGSYKTLVYLYPNADIKKASDWYYCKHTITLDREVELIGFQIYNHRWNNDPFTNSYYFNSKVAYKDLKLEKGNIATDWSPAIEDIDLRIQDQEVYYEYSQDGQSNWHIPPIQSTDNYQRLKKGNGIWSVPVRITGIPGAKGQDGQQLYTWIRYADSPTSGISSSPVNKNYVGYAYNKTSITPSNIYSDYDWQLTRGNTGEQGTPGAKGQDGQQLYNWIRYADSPTSGISNDPTNKTYMGMAVNKMTVTPSNIYSDYTWSLIKGDKGLQGIPGTKGQDGQQLYTWIRYADSPTSGISGIPNGKDYVGYAYNKVTITPSNIYSDYQWQLTKGDKGEQGTPGAKGQDGQQLYNWIRYADSPTSGMSSSPLGKSYMGIAVNKVSITPSNVYADYQWQLTKGNTGEQGVPGKAGVDGKTPFTHTAYSNSADGKKDFHLSDSNNRSFWGTYTDYTIQDSADPSKYSWIKVRGDAITSRTEPVNKYEGMLWIDSSKTPFEQKVWNGLKWELVGLSVNDIEIGGRNLWTLKNHTKNNYYVEPYHFKYDNDSPSNTPEGCIVPERDKILKVGEAITISYNIKLTWFPSNKTECSLRLVYREVGSGSYKTLVYLYPNVDIKKASDWYYCKHTITLDREVELIGFQIYNHRFYTDPLTNTYFFNSKVAYKDLKLEKGNVATDWSPAIEDTQAEIDALNLLSSQQRQELETVKRTTDKLNQVTNYLTTTVDGGVVTTSTLQVGATTTNASGQTVSKAKAGITGVASGNVANINLDRRVVFWASTGFAQRENALFQVWDDGYVVMEKARIKGHIEAESGYFKGRIEGNSGKIASFDIIGDFISTERLMYSDTKSIMKLGGGGLQVDFLRGTQTIGKIDTTGNQKWGELYNLMEIKSYGESSQGVSYNSLLLESTMGHALRTKGRSYLEGSLVVNALDGDAIQLFGPIAASDGGNNVGMGFTGVKGGMRFINGIMVG